MAELLSRAMDALTVGWDAIEEEEMETGMTNAEFDAFLETLAQLIEAKAKTVEEAAEIIRNKKIKA